MLFFTQKQKRYVLFLYIIGIVIGTLLFQYVYRVMNSELCTYTKILFDTNNIESIEKRCLMLYILGRRIKLLFLLILFSLTFVRKILHGIMVILAGVRYSVLISALTVLNQNKTILNFIELIMPQEVFYILFCLDNP